MTNPINLTGRSTPGSISNSTHKTAAAKTDSNNDSEANISSGDTVSLSVKSKQVIELQQQLKNAPKIDSAKIEAIKQEIANGNYPLDANKIAENLISLEQSLIE